MKKIIKRIYDITLRQRRLRRITDLLLPHMPAKGSILDLGCGNGDIARSLKMRRSALQFVGLDLKARPDADVPVMAYDGVTIPYPDGHFDYVMLITVLHHTDDYVPLLTEACRVAKKGLIIFDHQYRNGFEWLVLAIIDWPGNVPFGVYTPFNFKTRVEWKDLFKQLKLEETQHNDRVFLFGKWMDFILGRHMHFISVLSKTHEPL